MKMISRLVKAALVAPTWSGAVASAQALTAIAVCTVVAHQTEQTQNFLRLDRNESLPTISVEVGKTFLGALVVPSLLEEIFWRVALQPVGTSLPSMIGVNFAFAMYHVFGSVLLAEQLDGRQGARDVFRDPAFLSLAFVLGNACSWAYVHSSYSLWAPVLTHAIPVTVWLSFLQGNTALSTPGGLPKKPKHG
jgi:predicted Abi (CAAX) family protease